MSRTNTPEHDVRVKTFQLHNSADEDAMNAFLAGKTVRYWEAKFVTAPLSSQMDDSSDARGIWNIFLAYQDREVEVPQPIQTVRPGRQSSVIKKHSTGQSSSVSSEKTDNATEVRRPSETYKPNVPGQDMPLFESIRTWRNSRAREERVKPFLFFNNSQLEQIVATKPVSVEALKEIVTSMEPPLWEKYNKELLGFLDAARSVSPVAVSPVAVSPVAVSPVAVPEKSAHETISAVESRAVAEEDIVNG